MSKGFLINYYDTKSKELTYCDLWKVSYKEVLNAIKVHNFLYSTESIAKYGGKFMDVKEICNHDNSFKYQMLSRWKSDCDYFLGNGNRFPKHLWAGNVDEHISNMKELWKSFSDEEKPEWLSHIDILVYEARMSYICHCNKNDKRKVLDALVHLCYNGNLTWKEYENISFVTEPIDFSGYKIEDSHFADMISDNYEIKESSILLRGFYPTENWLPIIHRFDIHDFRDAGAINMYGWNDNQMIIFSYCEGDITLECFKDEESYVKELKGWHKWWEERK